MKKINCVVADDEPLAREVLERHIANIDHLELVCTCTNGIEAFNALRHRDVNLLFLDIQMPNLTGIELLKTLKNPPAVIITTAYREFAIEGYELNVLDYLLKPISFERFLKAIDKYESHYNPKYETSNAHLAEESKNDPRSFIYIKSDKKMIKTTLKDILYIEGLKDYVKVHTSSGSFVTYQTLTYFEEKLSVNHFIRVHRSYIISLDHINAYSATHVEIGKTSIPIGNSYSSTVFKRIKQ